MASQCLRRQHSEIHRRERPVGLVPGAGSVACMQPVAGGGGNGLVVGLIGGDPAACHLDALAGLPAGRARDRRKQRGLAYPSTRLLSFYWHSLSISIETPTTGRGGCSRMTVSPTASLALRGRANMCLPVTHRPVLEAVPLVLPAQRSTRAESRVSSPLLL